MHAKNKELQMRNRRKRRTGNRIIGVLIFLILLTIGAIAVVWGSRQAQPASVPAVIEDIDFRAKELEMSFWKRIRPQNAAGTFSYGIREMPSFTPDSGTLYIENPAQNTCLMAVELVREGEDEVIFRSGLLAPNQAIENAALDEMIPAGKYPVTALIYAIDPSSGDILGILEENITITVRS